jgi:hypothetical protein
MRGFTPYDAEFAMYLVDEGCMIDEMKRDEVERMRSIYSGEKIIEIEEDVIFEKVVEKPIRKRKSIEIIDPSDYEWKNITPSLTPKLVQE